MSHQRSTFFSLSLLTIALVAVAGLVVAFQASAGPISGGAGNAPFTKLAVYQGVLTVVPSSGSNLLEIGNNGQDIAGTADIYLRPGSLTSGAANYFRVYKNASNLASAIIPGDLGVGTASPTAKLNVRAAAIGAAFNGATIEDPAAERFRIGYSNTALDGTTLVPVQLGYGPGSGGGDLSGSLSIGSRGSVATGITLYTSPGSGLLPRVRVNNAGDLNIISGRLCFGNAAADCRNTWTGLGGGSTPTLDQVLAQGNASTSSAYLGVAAPQSANDTFGTYSNNALGGSAIYAQQSNASGYAGYFSGRSSFVASNNLGNDQAALSAYGTSVTSGAGTGNAAIYARGGQSNANGDITYAIKADSGLGSGGATAYAGYFTGRTAFVGVGGSPLSVTKGNPVALEVTSYGTTSVGTCTAFCAGAAQACIFAWANGQAGSPSLPSITRCDSLVIGATNCLCK